MEKLSDFQALEQYRQKLIAARDPEKPTITVCAGTGCKGCGADGVVAAFKEELAKRDLEGKVDLLATGCHGFCERGTLVVIRPQEYFYQLVMPKDVPEIIETTMINGEVVERLLYEDPQSGEKVLHEKDVPFYKYQQRQIFAYNGHLDPTDVGNYIALGGYAGLAKALSEMKPEQIVQDVKDAGLRGRGGGGFPAGRKWETVRNAEGDPKYVLCNADEGDPGAYMDRSLLEGNPHLVIEGMIIGAYAIGSNHGYIYVRNEYPLAVQNTYIALDQARELGLLGENILGSGFSFDIQVSRGGGAFVCGESTALMASLEGQPGEPRAKYVHTAERGLYEKPTNLNNVETWANVPFIVREGVKKYRAVGTEGSPGTKIFSLVGKINNTGLVEVPMGITLREIIYDVGGGIPGGKAFKAVQTGGPSGGCLPADKLDLPIDYESLTKAGSIMGSGGMIVMDENTCMVDVAKYFLNFLREESCGKCVSCREGTQRMWEIVDDITKGEGSEESMAVLEELALIAKDASMCGLGQTASNPVLSTLRYFRDEYLAHVNDKRCPAGVCKDLITYSVIDENCTGCLACKRVCPSEAITGELKEVHVIHAEKCIKCGACFEACNFDAIKVE